MKKEDFVCSDELISELCLYLEEKKYWEILCKVKDIEYKILEERFNELRLDR